MPNMGSVLLINLPAFWKPADYLRPPLGLLYIGATLRRHGFAVRLFDFENKDTSWEEVEECLRQGPRSLLGFTCDTDNIFRVFRTSRRVLAQYENAQVVLGGPHVSHAGTPYVSDRCMVVRGEGELPMLRLAEYVLNGRGSLAGVPGLMFKANGSLQENPLDSVITANVDDYPFPDYSLLPKPE